jgi:hypothetical protein
MTSRFESTSGGLQQYVRTLARRASIDDSWIAREPQTVLLDRTASLPGATESSLSVSFEARRANLTSFGAGALRTFYTIRAVETQDQMVLDELPSYVRASLSIVGAEHAEAGELTIISTGRSEEETERLLEADAQEDLDVRFRYEKVLQYRLNGNARLLSSERRDRYVSTEDTDEEEIYDRYIFQSAYPELEESGVLDLSAWARDREEIPENERLIVPVDTDIQFLDIVQGYVESRDLTLASRKEHSRAILSLLAFLNFEGSATEVRELI